MSGTPTPSTPPESPPRWRWRPPAVDWRPKLRWFGAEILIVVAGVLIALALNAWWADRDARVRERLVLEDLREDFRFNKSEVQRIRDVSELFLAQFDRLAALPEDSIASLPPDSAFAYAEPTFISHTFDPVTGSLDALIASGDLGLIQDQALRERLTSFLEVLRDSDEEKQAVFDQIVLTIEEASRLGGPWSGPGTPFPMAPDDLIRLREDTDYMTSARQLRWMAWYYAEVELSEVEVAIDSVLVRLDSNLTL